MMDTLDHAALIAFVRPLVGDEAEDIVQATYVRILETTAPHKGHSSKQTWACAIARGLAIDLLRKRGRSVPTVPFTDGEGSLADGTSRPASVAVAPADVDGRLDAETRFGRLSGIEQQVLLESRTPEREAARRLGLPRRVLRGRRLLLRRKLIQDT